MYISVWYDENNMWSHDHTCSCHSSGQPGDELHACFERAECRMLHLNALLECTAYISVMATPKFASLLSDAEASGTDTPFRPQQHRCRDSELVWALCQAHAFMCLLASLIVSSLGCFFFELLLFTCIWTLLMSTDGFVQYFVHHRMCKGKYLS